MSFPILTCIVFAPLAGSMLILFTPKKNVNLIKVIATLATAAALCLSVLLLIKFNYSSPAMQFEEKAAWIPSINAWYHLGADGISVGLIFLTTLLSFLACIGSSGIKIRQKEYFFLYLLLSTGMLGTFTGLDMVLFYMFWEIVLVPMYFLIGIWGGQRKEYAAIKFFIYTLAGSVFMLLGILALYFTSTPHTFDILELTKTGGALTLSVQILIFIAFYLGFAVKVPVFPFHTWLPDAHVEAPTPISVLLAGVLLKMGGYGFFRISFPILKDAAHYFILPFAILGMINIIYGALVAMAQTDFKKMVAYSSVSHMGFVMLGLASMTATGFNGALLEMFNHGIITAGMFFLVGVLYDRAHTRELDKFGGLGVKMPVYAGMLSVFALASLGLPGLSGFISEFMSLLGTYPTFKLITIISSLGLIITAGYFLYMLQRILLGPVNEKWSAISDINKRELLTLIPLLIIVVIIGIYPLSALKYQIAAISALVQNLGGIAF
ncbi:MAG: oxidoreductase [Candidatus Omnitrophica bacterium CG1_02_44_16]|nr:MAG: oxidoreductase [Candidatus Omnitrophica bacterium CG1_02_44_16]PIY82252.1 MAG: oxidoreductase [Candidatus Omnitrophica bacterium CG_4_10_14_0_8_um_filter_44_12]PIZ83652.1 MAG: oxidoreductase [Candidatus Omnitrophica bacterium CG_4_10_14_0_2_um_filter_44_9]